MARVVTYPHPVEQRGIARQMRARHGIGRATAVGALLYLLALVGSIVVRATTPLQRACTAWAQARRERAEDRKLWELAQSDSRVMADLIALQQHAERQA